MTQGPCLLFLSHMLVASKKGEAVLSAAGAVCQKGAWFGVLGWSSGTEVGTCWSQLIKPGRGDCELTAFGGNTGMRVAWPWWKGFYLRAGKKPPARTPSPL